MAADYTGTADRAKSDPDISLIRIDRYDADSHRASLTSSLSFNFRSLPWLRRVDFRASASYGRERLVRERQVAPSRPVVAPVSSAPGVHDGVFITGEYISHYLSDGRPLSLFAKLSLGGPVPVWSAATQTYKAGVEWTMDKNYGRGQVYDPMKPLSASWTSRPRAYRDIPALNTVSFYAEDNLNTEAGYGTLELQAGFHGIVMAGLDRSYALAGKVYIDPRLNAVWRLPSYTAGPRALDVFIAAGYGTTTRMPTADYLYPQAAYLDLLQLNYFNTADPAASRVSLRTYVNDATNYGLRAARNRKWEVRAGAQLGGNRLSVTYFEEHMNSGFRYSTVYGAYEYTRYDPSGIEPGASVPALDGLPSTQERVLRGYRRAENGSRIDKRGVESRFPVDASGVVTPRLIPGVYDLELSGTAVLESGVCCGAPASRPSCRRSTSALPPAAPTRPPSPTSSTRSARRSTTAASIPCRSWAIRSTTPSTTAIRWPPIRPSAMSTASTSAAPSAHSATASPTCLTSPS